MRKTYKPLARVEKASQIFKRKTLNVNDELNIRHDEDDIENVDEYWSTAVSVIGNSTIDSMDQDKAMEPSDTLFNINSIRKSIQGNENKAEKLYRASVSGGRATAHENERTGDKMPGKAAIIKRVYTQEDGDSLIKLSDLGVSDECSNDNAQEPHRQSSSQDGYDGFEMEAGVSSDHFPIDCGEADVKENHMNIGEKEGDAMALKSFNTVRQQKLKPIPKVVPDSETESATEESQGSSTQTARRAPTKASARKRTKIEAHRPQKEKRPHSFVVETPVLEQRKNVVTPLVCSPSLDMATMSLDFMAYIENYKTETAFSVYIIKGKIELTVNGSTKIATKGSVSVVEKDDVCSINCISKGGAVVLLSYAL